MPENVGRLLAGPDGHIVSPRTPPTHAPQNSVREFRDHLSLAGSLSGISIPERTDGAASLAAAPGDEFTTDCAGQGETYDDESVGG